MWEDDFFFDFKRFRDKMEKAFSGFPNFDRNMPATDISETDEDVVIKLDMPGIEKDDIEIFADENMIEVRAGRQKVKEKRDKNFYRRERGFRSYYRKIPLPVRIKTNIEAEYHNGVLTLTAEKKEKTKVKKKKIKIK